MKKLALMLVAVLVGVLLPAAQAEGVVVKGLGTPAPKSGPVTNDPCGNCY